MAALCPHCGYKRNPYTGNCQNRMCQGPKPAVAVDPDALAAAIALREENRRKSEETMRELWLESVALGGCRVEDVPAQYRPTVAEHLKSITNQKLWGSLAR